MHSYARACTSAVAEPEPPLTLLCVLLSCTQARAQQASCRRFFTTSLAPAFDVYVKLAFGLLVHKLASFLQRKYSQKILFALMEQARVNGTAKNDDVEASALPVAIEIETEELTISPSKIMQQRMAGYTEPQLSPKPRVQWSEEQVRARKCLRFFPPFAHTFVCTRTPR